jgi:molybdenum cofactor cytidylyltransferase
VARPLRTSKKMNRDPSHAVVLAAGASTRMDRHKALLEFDRKTALRLLVGSLRRAGIEDITVVVSGEGRVADEARRCGASIAVNAESARGRTGSLQAALRALSRDRAVLVAPVDCPLVSAATVRAVLAQGRPGAIVRPRVAAGAGHPVLFAPEILPEIERLRPDEPLRAVVHRDPSRVVDVEVDDEEVRANLDTPEDYARALARRRRPP